MLYVDVWSKQLIFGHFPSQYYFNIFTNLGTLTQYIDTTIPGLGHNLNYNANHVHLDPVDLVLWLQMHGATGFCWTWPLTLDCYISATLTVGNMVLGGPQVFITCRA